MQGIRYFNEANIRASLIGLEIGRAPRLGAIFESIQLANESCSASRADESNLSESVEHEVGSHGAATP